MKTSRWISKRILALCGVLALALPAYATEVEGVKLDDNTRVANADLKLNGAGVRYKLFFKVYVAGLYLPDRKNSVSDILAITGPRRISLTMLREVSAETFGQSFMDGLANNNSVEERARIINQMLSFGQMFGAYHSLKPGDTVTVDWIPPVGTVVQLNGKKISDALPDVAFYNALLKIWIGDQPADKSLKKALLGGQVAKADDHAAKSAKP
ncbi:MAG: chalcone isomerase family protein [Burkholderiales bacterium]|nr:chalcone isomerase family protein [Burkholderiales bacterium]